MTYQFPEGRTAEQEAEHICLESNANASRVLSIFCDYYAYIPGISDERFLQINEYLKALGGINHYSFNYAEAAEYLSHAFTWHETPFEDEWVKLHTALCELAEEENSINDYWDEDYDDSDEGDSVTLNLEYGVW